MNKWKKSLSEQQIHKKGFYEKYIKRPQDFCCALIEFNGMWEVAPFLEGKLPPEWPLYQIVTTVNAETFELYSNRKASDTCD